MSSFVKPLLAFAAGVLSLPAIAAPVVSARVAELETKAVSVYIGGLQ